MALLRLCACFFLLSFYLDAPAQPPLSLDIQWSDASTDTLLLSRQLGNRYLPLDTLIRKPEGHFAWQATTLPDPGFYQLSNPSGNETADFLLDRGESRFRMQRESGGLLVFQGAPANERWQQFLRYRQLRAPEFDNVRKALTYLERKGEDAAPYRQRLQKLRDDQRSLMESTIAEDQNSLLASLLPLYLDKGDAMAFSLLEFPAPHRAAVLQSRAYFDQVQALLTQARSDSLQVGLDRVLGQTQSDPEAFAFYTGYFLSLYARPETEAIFVHLADRYLALARALPEAERRRFRQQADRLSPLLKGRKAPALSIPRFDVAGTLARAQDPDPQGRFTLSESIDLHQIDAELTLLLVWKPDCSHCVESLPELVSLYEQYHPKGLEVLAIVYQDAWGLPESARILQENGAINWINAADPQQRSRFMQKYNVSSTPQLFLLGKNKEILEKDLNLKSLKKELSQRLGEQKP